MGFEPFMITRIDHCTVLFTDYEQWCQIEVGVTMHNKNIFVFTKLRQPWLGTTVHDLLTDQPKDYNNHQYKKKKIQNHTNIPSYWTKTTVINYWKETAEIHICSRFEKIIVFGWWKIMCLSSGFSSKLCYPLFYLSAGIDK